MGIYFKFQVLAIKEIVVAVLVYIILTLLTKLVEYYLGDNIIITLATETGSITAVT